MALTVQKYASTKNIPENSFMRYITPLKHVFASWKMEQERYKTQLTLGYQRKIYDDEHYSIILRSHEGTYKQVFPSQSARFTEKYRKRTYYKLALLEELQPRAFCTLTVPFNEKWDAWTYDLKIKSFSKKWQRLRSYMWRYGVKFDYFRVFEVTKNGMLHCHFIIYEVTSKILNHELELMARYWDKKYGFVKFYKFHYTDSLETVFELRINKYYKKKGKKIETYRSCHWVVKNYTDIKNNGKSRIATNYVMKYQLKESSMMARAILTKYRIRSYSYSQSLKYFIRKIESSGKYILHSKGYNQSLEHVKKSQNSYIHSVPSVQKYEKYRSNPYIALRPANIGLNKGVLQLRKMNPITYYSLVVIPSLKKYLKSLPT